MALRDVDKPDAQLARTLASLQWDIGSQIGGSCVRGIVVGWRPVSFLAASGGGVGDSPLFCVSLGLNRYGIFNIEVLLLGTGVGSQFLKRPPTREWFALAVGSRWVPLELRIRNDYYAVHRFQAARFQSCR